MSMDILAKAIHFAPSVACGFQTAFSNVTNTSPETTELCKFCTVPDWCDVTDTNFAMKLCLCLFVQCDRLTFENWFSSCGEHEPFSQIEFSIAQQKSLQKHSPHLHPFHIPKSCVVKRTHCMKSKVYPTLFRRSRIGSPHSNSLPRETSSKESSVSLRTRNRSSFKRAWCRPEHLSLGYCPIKVRLDTYRFGTVLSFAFAHS